MHNRNTNRVVFIINHSMYIIPIAFIITIIISHTLRLHAISSLLMTAGSRWCRCVLPICTPSAYMGSVSTPSTPSMPSAMMLSTCGTEVDVDSRKKGDYKKEKLAREDTNRMICLAPKTATQHRLGTLGW